MEQTSPTTGAFRKRKHSADEHEIRLRPRLDAGREVESKDRMSSLFPDMAVELVVQIFSYLPPAEIKSAETLSSDFHEMINSSDNDSLVFKRQAGKQPTQLLERIALITEPCSEQTSFLQELGRFLAHRGIDAKVAGRYNQAEFFINWYVDRQIRLVQDGKLDQGKILPQHLRKNLRQMIMLIIDIHIHHHCRTMYDETALPFFDRPFTEHWRWIDLIGRSSVWTHIARKKAPWGVEELERYGIVNPVDGTKVPVVLSNDPIRGAIDIDFCTFQELSAILEMELPELPPFFSYCVKGGRVYEMLKTAADDGTRLTYQQKAFILEQQLWFY
jgi:hypothetical protein